MKYDAFKKGITVFIIIIEVTKLHSVKNNDMNIDNTVSLFV